MKASLALSAFKFICFYLYYIWDNFSLYRFQAVKQVFKISAFCQISFKETLFYCKLCICNPRLLKFCIERPYEVKSWSALWMEQINISLHSFSDPWITRPLLFPTISSAQLYASLLTWFKISNFLRSRNYQEAKWLIILDKVVGINNSFHVTFSH